MNDGPSLSGPGMPPSVPPVSAVPLAAGHGAAMRQAFGHASETLLSWPREIDGAWIDRPELARLRDRLRSPAPTVTALLGEPGAGKSALLARLGTELRADGVALLALKADQLPRGITSLQDLDAEIGGPVPVAEALRRLAAEAVTLAPPAWADVEALLNARGLASGGWSPETREVLRTPQLLALFLDQKAFLETLWPCLLRILEALGDDAHPFLIRYRGTHGLAFQDQEASTHESPVHAALMAAARGFAAADPEAFLAFVLANRHREWMAVHRLLAVGLAEIATTHPYPVLAYLLEDSRRLAIGDDQNVHRDSKALIAILTPILEVADRQRLEQAIRTWEHYRFPIPGEDRELRFKRRKWTRQHRLRLFRAIPQECLTEQGRRHLAEELRALPDVADHDMGRIKTYWVDSVVPAERMPGLSDDAIVQLFEFLSDEVEENPNRRFGASSGGSVEASRAFEELAKTDPKRAIRLLARFRPGRQERPTGLALRAIAENKDEPPDTVIDLVHALHARGFASDEFREEAAMALASVASRARGLPDATIDLLEAWLADRAARDRAWDRAWDRDEVDGTDPVVDMPSGREERADSLLWGDDGVFGLPHGRYRAIRAVALGLLCREPMDADGWLRRLEVHVEGPVDPQAWSALTSEFRYLKGADRTRTLTFIERLLRRYPDIRASRPGTRLVAHFLDWLPSESLETKLSEWLSGRWSKGPQAAGEIATLMLFRAPGDPALLRRVQEYIDAPGFPEDRAAGVRLGVAYAVVRYWREPSLRTMATDLLVRLMPFAEEPPVCAVLRRLVNTTKPLPPDDDTVRFFKHLLRRPGILTGGETTLVGERLKDLLAAGFDTEIIHAVTAVLVTAMEKALRDRSGTWVGNPGDLVDIALTLQREPTTRSLGLDLFERLLDVGETEARLRQLDRRPFDS